MAKSNGGLEVFNAELSIEYIKSTEYTEEYNKTVILTEGVCRQIVGVKLTAPTLEKLQEKLVAYVGLAEL
jgi:hypothetical protein